MIIGDDFIGIFHNVLTVEECQKYIEYFEVAKDLNMTWNRQANAHIKSDEALLLEENITIPGTAILVSDYNKKFWDCYEEYVTKYSVLRDIPLHGILHLKMQKTNPGEAYHVWHFESDAYRHCSRILVYMIYLNDVEEGGETEFLYLKKRIKPESGKVLIWPAGYTHTHRGNPPLSSTKYIITGWVEYLLS
ncbi:MAG TPA: 2OG-Fe(II) oxygenase [Methylomirabilota bacterium]|nr:2OG-Fe(II) oxygenase [Methylomirabilota bacterium]